VDLYRHQESIGSNAELGDAFVTQPAAELVAFYVGWSNNPDDDMDGFGYRHPVVFILFLTRYVPQDDGRLPGAEVGTGIVGRNTIDGVDISQVTFGKAAEKSLYPYLNVTDINQPLVLGSDSHSLISNGFFTTGHFGSDGFGQVLAGSEAIGHLLITVKTNIWHDNIPPYLYALWRCGKIWILDQTDPYVLITGPRKPSQAL
jgi:hypothetical protein